MSENETLFINRELSWLRFNSRVLAQCEKDIPLLEKLKFIAIYNYLFYNENVKYIK